MAAVNDQYREAWEAWHRVRIEELTSPYGWTSMVSQDWLLEGVPLRVEDVPGSWLVTDGAVTYLPDESGDTVTVEGTRVTVPTVISTGHKYSLVPAFAGDLKIETIKRTDVTGKNIFGVRVRDPKEAARKRIADIETYPLDERWVVPARFTRTADRSTESPTVERGVFEEQRVIGTVTFELEGREYVLEVAGRPDDDTGIERGNVHVTDATSGKETYGNGRIVQIPGIESDCDTVIDFNRAISFPCAFTNFVTCPLAPPQNRLDVAVTAGEKKPPQQIDRIQTYPVAG